VALDVVQLNLNDFPTPLNRQNIFDLIYQADPQGNDVLCTTDGSRYTGIVFEALSSGYVTAEYEIKNGIKDGIEKEFYGDGSVECLAHFRQGLLHGEVTYFYGDGIPKEKSVFEYGIWLEGFEWDESGNLINHNRLDPVSARFEKVRKLREQYNW